MPRTDPGEGSVYQRKDGRWVAVLRWDQPDGTQKRIPCYGATRAQALAARRERRQMEAARVARQQTPTVAEWLADWQAAQAGRWAPGTRERVAVAVRRHIGPALGPQPLHLLTPPALEAWAADLRAGGLAPTTIAGIWHVLRSACAAAVRAGLLPTNPVAAATRPPSGLPRTACLSAAEAAAVLALVGAIAPRWWPLLSLAVHTGLRRGELLGLSWAAVDFTRNTLTVTHSLSGYNRATWDLRPPKTARSARTLPLTLPMRAALEAQQAQQTAARATAGAAWAPPWPDLVFTSRVGTPIVNRNVGRAWHRYSARAGVPVLPFHSLRHTAATLLLDAQLPLPVVLAWFGWSSSAMLTRVYAHPRLTDLAQVGAALATRLLHSDAGTKKEATASLSFSPDPNRDKVVSTPLLQRPRHESRAKWAKKPLKTPDV